MSYLPLYSPYCISDHRVYAFINIHVTRPIHSAFGVLIVKVDVPVLNEGLIEV